MEKRDLKRYLDVKKDFDYKKSNLNKFIEKILETQRYWKREDSEGNKIPRFTAKFIFLDALSLDRTNWKTQLSTGKIDAGNKKIKALLKIFNFNQEIILDKMIEDGNSYRIWLTMYANEYTDSVDNNNKDKILIEIKGKTNKLKVKDND